MKLRVLRIQGPRLRIAIVWLLTGAFMLWAIAKWYLPITSPFRPPMERWVLGVILLYLAAVSLAIHQLAHVLAARLYGNPLPIGSSLYPLGDAAHKWLPALKPGPEVGIALAGPIASGLVAMFAFLSWRWPYAPNLTSAWLFLFFVNAGLAIVNLAPGFPLDGGRLTRAIIWHFLGRADWGHRVAHAIGRVIVVILLLCAFYLLAPQTTISVPTGATTAGVALLVIVGITDRATWARAWPDNAVSGKPGGALWRGMLSGFLISLLALISISIMPTPNGLYMPGEAVAVEPMLKVPEEYRHPYRGRYFATTVITQTPIVAGQWLYGYFSPVAELVPPTYIVPANTKPEEVIELNVEMLRESELVAAAVALRHAGFDAWIIRGAAQVQGLLPESGAQHLVRPGDLIIGVGGVPVHTVQELAAELGAYDPEEIVILQLMRDGEVLHVGIPLLAPLEPEGPTRLGLEVESIGLDINLPFEVNIQTRAITGGPSAGLMFALAIYDMVTPGEMVAGRRVAGTGTIRPDGTVGPIGGVEQKVAAAERVGANYFLSPLENAADARAVARRIEVVPVGSFTEAVDFLNRAVEQTPEE